MGLHSSQRPLQAKTGFNGWQRLMMVKGLASNQISKISKVLKLKFLLLVSNLKRSFRNSFRESK